MRWLKLIFTFHYVYIYIKFIILQAKRGKIYIPLCLYLYILQLDGVIEGIKFTFHYVYIYIY